MKKLLLIIILIAAIGAGIYRFFPKGNFSIIPEQKNLTETLTFGNFLTSNYSFSSDADFDGLSDAKEIIYGSDPLRADTDGDGFLDGKEVAQGFDPLVAGKGTGRLSDRKNPSLTVQYFSWLSEKTGNPDPQLKESDIEEFLTQRGLLSFSLPVILDSDVTFTNNDPQKIADYIKVTTGPSLSQEGSPYLALAGQLVKNKSFDALEKVVKNVQSGLTSLQKLPVPSLARELHQHYFGIWQELDAIFEELRNAQKDPVVVFLNQKRGEWLADKVAEGERLRADLIAKVKLLPFNSQVEEKP